MGETERVLALAADIERRDGEVARSLELVGELSRRAGEVRARASELDALLAATPGELAALDRSEAEDRDARASATEELAAAERAAAEPTGRRVSVEQRREAVRRVEHAQERLDEVTARVERHEAERVALIAIESDARREAVELAGEAADLAARLHGVPRISQSGREEPGAGLAGIVSWGGRVHAALFVVRGQLEAERDRIVREANELGGAVLGEHLAGSSVALVRRRLEEALRR